MSRWHAIRVREDLYRALQAQATRESRSVAGQLDFVLSRALEQGPESTGSSASPTRGGLAAPARAPVAQRIEGQTTVDEMLASCPNCAGPFISDPDGNESCEDCGYVRGGT